MIAISLDPHLLVIDPTDADRAQLVADSVLSWSTLRGHPQLTLCITQKTLEALIEDDRLPVYSEVIRALASLKVEYADAYTVAQTMMFFVTNASELESVLGISDVLFAEGFSWADACQCKTIPSTCAEAKRVLGILALRQQLGPDIEIRLAQASPKGGASLRIRGTIELAEMREPKAEFPVDVDQLILACASAETLLRSLDSLKIWIEAETDDDLALAIKAAAERLRQSAATIKRVEIGDNFTASVKSLHFDRDNGKASRLLDACAEVTTDSKLRQTHAIRTSKGGNAPQIRNGGAKAWRKDIDHDFHLHYWELEDGGIRLASVVPHSDFSIPW
jgi:hypothetical protein